MNPLEAEQFRSALSDLLAGDAFQRSPALGRLLTFLVERTIAGEAGTLKESVIGHELYERPASYDPKLDSVVRVSANRLRVRLEDHYRGNPQQLRLTLPKGSYVPQLQVHEAAFPPTLPELTRAAVDEEPARAEPVLEPSRTQRLAPWQKRPLLFASSLTGTVLLGLVFWVAARRPPATTTTAAAPEIAWSVRPFARLGGSQQFGEFSPDGTRLAFNSTTTSDENKVVYIQSIASEEAQRIAPGLRPAWAPDGKRLAFLRPKSDGKKQVVVHNLETGQEENLAELEGGGSWLCQIPRLSWSADGRIIYTTTTASHGRVCGLVSIDLASQRITPLLSPSSPGGDLEPAMSPDGSTIAFMRGLGAGASDIFLVSTHGGGARRLTYDGTDLLGFDWTPDAKSLIVASTREGGVRRLWRFPVSGGTPRALLDGLSDPGFPSISSSGKEIAFTQFHTTAPIWQADTRGSTPLLDNQSRNTKPTVSTDGRWLLYGSNRAGKDQLWVSHLDGSEAHPLIPKSEIETGAARWSRDVTSIVMECHLAKRTHICLSKADGSGFRQLTNGDASQFNPSWSNDGRFVYFTSDSGGGGQIYRMDVQSGAVLQVTHQGAHRALESADGKWVFIASEQPGGGLIALPVGGSEADWRSAENVSVLPEFHSYSGSDWDVSKDGVVYMVPHGEHAPSLNVFSLRTRTSRALLSLREARAGDDISLDVLPDGKAVIYTVTHTSSELTIMSEHR